MTAQRLRSTPIPGIRDSYTGVDYNLGFHVRHYEMSLDYRVAANRLSGEARLTLDNYQPLAHMTLDLAEKMNVRGVAVQVFGLSGIKVKRFKHSGGKLRISFDKPIPVDQEFQLTINYQGNPQPINTVWGTLGWEELTNGSLVASQPCGAPSFFPCDDTPDEKATYHWRITADNPYQVIANGQLISTTTHGSRTTWEWRSTQPMASYLAAVHVGAYVDIDGTELASTAASGPDTAAVSADSTSCGSGSSGADSAGTNSADTGSSGSGSSGSGSSGTAAAGPAVAATDTATPAAGAAQGTSAAVMGASVGKGDLGAASTGDAAHAPTPPVPIRLHFPAAHGAYVRHDFAAQAQMMAVFTHLFGPYPFDSYRVVITEDSLEIPLEAQGLSVFGRNHATGERTWERLIAHELAHQWFGNSAGLAQWEDMWLNEGAACYAEWLWFEHSQNRPAAVAARNHYDLLAQLPQDILLANPTPELLFDDRLYKRGAVTFHALRVALGDEFFFPALRSYLAGARYSVVEPHDLIRAMSQAAADPNCPATPEQVTGIINAWVQRRELPPFPEAR